MSALVVGTAGWALNRAVQDRFPGEGTHLQRYGARLAGVEINSSFYRPHRRETYARWAASVPEHFRFAVKLPRSITHERRLVGCEDLLDRFAGEVEGLGSKLGPLLLQLPPSLRFDAAGAGAFLAALQNRLHGPLVCEPRHASWFSEEAEVLMRGAGVARVAADPVPAAGAGEPGGAATLVYFRLHGSPRMYYSNYEQDRLDAIGRTLSESVTAGVETWCIFDNTAEGFAIENALALTRSVVPGG